jgi:class 3 adenylate cyclase
MTEAERKLAAILSADVVGYSRLMSEDEAATIITLRAYREEIAMLVRQQRGRVVDSQGWRQQGDGGRRGFTRQCFAW